MRYIITNNGFLGLPHKEYLRLSSEQCDARLIARGYPKEGRWLGITGCAEKLRKKRVVVWKRECVMSIFGWGDGGEWKAGAALTVCTWWIEWYAWMFSEKMFRMQRAILKQDDS